MTITYKKKRSTHRASRQTAASRATGVALMMTLVAGCTTNSDHLFSQNTDSRAETGQTEAISRPNTAREDDIFAFPITPPRSALTQSTELPGPVTQTTTTNPLSTASINPEQLPNYNKLSSHVAGSDQSILSETSPLEPSATASSIWPRIREGFRFQYDNYPRKLIEAHKKNYLKHPKYLNRVIKRSEPYLHYIVERIDSHQLPMELALLPIVESAFDPFAYSHSNASGIWQFISSTGKMYGLKQNWWYDGRRDVVASTEAALSHFVDLGKKFDENWFYSLGAYNAGVTAVKRAINKNKHKKRSTDFWQLKLPRETRHYVPKLLALREIVADPEGHGFAIRDVKNEARVTLVDVESQIDLAKAAELASMSIEELYRLNPGFNRWATDPDGPHFLLIPVERAANFEKRLAKLSNKDRVQWVRYKVRRGDSLSEIAQGHRTTVRTLKRVNQLRGTHIRIGQALLIPRASMDEQLYALSSDQRQQARKKPAKGNSVRQEYRVKAGDSLWLIAKNHDVSVKELRAWNGLRKNEKLRVKQKLTIWKPSKNNITLAQRSSNPAAERRIAYRIRNGDSLSKIAQRFRLQVHQIQQWNDLDPSRYLQPGQMLTLYVDLRYAP